MKKLENRLLFGDNLKWLRDPKLFPDASIDLVYLDPPFSSNAIEPFCGLCR
jgi:16S rRNA G966 N2-methylase RsmD